MPMPPDLTGSEACAHALSSMCTLMMSQRMSQSESSKTLSWIEEKQGEEHRVCRTL